MNRNKESVVLDLKTDAGLAAARKLIARADVVVENFKDSDRERFGLSAASIHALNPRAVVCSIIGFDRDSAEAALPAYDLLAQAAGGMMRITGEPGGPPVKVGVAISDVLTAHYAHGAILAALYAREKSGKGDAIEISLVGATVASLVNVAQSYLVTREEPQRHGSAHPSIVPYQSFAAADRPFVVAVATDRHFQLFARDVVGRDDLASSERFATNAARVENRRELIRVLEYEIARRPAETWVAACRERGIPAALVERFEEIFAQPITESVDHPTAGRLEMVRSPIRPGAARVVRRPPPRLGEHTDAILAERGPYGTKSGSGA